jgi:hypothetical protein
MSGMAISLKKEMPDVAIDACFLRLSFSNLV